MTLALLTCDLGAVFELIGATSAAAMAYILPPICYMKLSTRSWQTMLAAGSCATFGCIVMAISLVQAVFKMINSKAKGSDEVPLFGADEGVLDRDAPSSCG